MKRKNALSFAREKTVVLLTVFLTTVFLFMPLFSVLALDLGQQYLPLTGLGTRDIRIIIMNIIQIALSLLGIIALIIILYGGFVWMTSAGESDRVERAKRIIVNAAIGLLIILLSLSIVTFVIRMMQQAMTGRGVVNPPPWEGCVNCGALGGGIIESVYPAPGARDVPRNTGIFVTFKEDMFISSIIEPVSGSVVRIGDISDNTHDDGIPNIRIYETRLEGDDYLEVTEVVASAAGTDDRAFSFRPKNYLGDGVNRIWYTVMLADDIMLADGTTSAFPGNPGYFSWSFEVNTMLDFQPPQVESVFPYPDDAGDMYRTDAAEAATASIDVNALPQIFVPASLGSITVDSGTVGASLSGSYDCAQSADICVYTGDGLNFSVSGHNQGSGCDGGGVAVSGLTLNPPLTNGYIDIGCGVRMLFDSSPQSGNRWVFTAVAQSSADQLRISNKTYTFVAGTAGAGEIDRGNDIFETARAIADKIEDTADGVANVSASAANNIVNLTADDEGSAGNNIPLEVTGSWGVAEDFSGGRDAGYVVTVSDRADQPRNAVIQINFNEAMNFTVAVFSVLTDLRSGAHDAIGSLLPTDFRKITVQVDYDDDGNFESDEYVAGEFKVSNMYKTLEFIPSKICTDISGRPIYNSCGDPIFCLPIDDNGQDAEYKVTIVASSLKAINCAGEPAAECPDPAYSDITQSICSLQAGAGCSVGCICSYDNAVVLPEKPLYFPGSDIVNDGSSDAQNNSLDGNYDNKTWGPGTETPNPPNQSNANPYNLNTADASLQGDSFTWGFFINDRIDLLAPQISDVRPDPNATQVGTTMNLEAEFSKILMYSTLKPDNSYKDGYCFCSNDGQCGTNNSCGGNDYCQDSSDQPILCRQNSDCLSNFCQNKEYMTLINNPTRPSGYWISGYNQDTDSDGLDNTTVAVVNHTPFMGFYSYGARAGSGIKDIYQNCYLPAIGEGGCTGAVLTGNVLSCATVSCSQMGGTVCTTSCYDSLNNPLNLVYSTVDTTTCCPMPGVCQ
ncbi:hypothetical protein C4572_04240 [Candidatus Parcubacteria bacterium]|nr:MAG: hypothetical protein C4572_04240 [Candidatus Parcubacteria bacterium]